MSVPPDVALSMCTGHANVIGHLDKVLALLASGDLDPSPLVTHHMKLDDENWHCFTLSRYDRNTGEWAMEKAPVYHIID